MKRLSYLYFRKGLYGVGALTSLYLFFFSSTGLAHADDYGCRIGAPCTLSTASSTNGSCTVLFNAAPAPYCACEAVVSGITVIEGTYACQK